MCYTNSGTVAVTSMRHSAIYKTTIMKLLCGKPSWRIHSKLKLNCQHCANEKPRQVLQHSNWFEAYYNFFQTTLSRRSKVMSLMAFNWCGVNDTLLLLHLLSLLRKLLLSWLLILLLLWWGQAGRDFFTGCTASVSVLWVWSTWTESVSCPTAFCCPTTFLGCNRHGIGLWSTPAQRPPRLPTMSLLLSVLDRQIRWTRSRVMLSTSCDDLHRKWRKVLTLSAGRNLASPVYWFYGL